jgi:hypothetical protein
LLIHFVLILGTGSACDKGVNMPANANHSYTDIIGGKMIIKIGARTFPATLYDNATAAAFKKLLPLTVDMTELNGNEKYVDLSVALPADASNPGTIQNGDIMLYGSSTLVVFYKTFKTSYKYSRVGKIDDVTGFRDAVGQGSVTVEFVLQK